MQRIHGKKKVRGKEKKRRCDADAEYVHTPHNTAEVSGAQQSRERETERERKREMYGGVGACVSLWYSPKYDLSD